MPASLQTTPSLRERLTDDQVLDSLGNPIDPGDALPLPLGLRVPTMLVERELNYLHWLGASLKGAGRVVELGCFLGGSTAALVEGMKRSTAPHKPVLVYDAFEAPNDEAVTNSWWMKQFNLAPGENFRKRYEVLHHNRLNHLTIREGWLPPKISPEDERSLYPEQEPIELLFIDAAKTSDVHRTILRTFGRHLKPGSIVVQQDFVEMMVPWLPLHMWQLRHVFEPLDAVRRTPTVAFRCVADPAPAIEQLWAESDLLDPIVRHNAWQRVHQYWSDVVGPNAAGFVHGHAARHAEMVADAASTVDASRAYEAWVRSAGCAQVYVSPFWDEYIVSLHDRLLKTVSTQSPLLDRLRILAAESAVRCSVSRKEDLYAQGYCLPLEHRDEIWNAVSAHLQSSGHQKIALFGAGAHTTWLFESGWPKGNVEITCILDDWPREDSLNDIPVVMPGEAGDLLNGVTAIVPSSDAHELQLIAQAQERFGSTSYEIIPVYTRPGVASEQCVQAMEDYLPTASVEDDQLEGIPPSFVPSEAPERTQLGLSATRSWTHAFVDRFASPQWARGFVRFSDALFLWDVIEAAKPRRAVEIGTASGVSTAALISAIAHFSRLEEMEGQTLVSTFDIASRCYFDGTRPIGAAVAQVVPDLVNYVSIHPGTTAIDAAKHFNIGQIDFAFIDGDHRHPIPTIDLIALLYALKPGAFVVLHDVEMQALGASVGASGWDVVTGAEQLFKRWPFEKIQPCNDDPALNNIGAIRMPANPADAAEFLVTLLHEPWETHEAPPEAIADALEPLGLTLSAQTNEAHGVAKNLGCSQRCVEPALPQKLSTPMAPPAAT